MLSATRRRVGVGGLRASSATGPRLRASTSAGARARQCAAGARPRAGARRVRAEARAGAPENKLKAEKGNTSSVDERFAELYSTIAELTRENKRLGLAATLAQSQCAEQLASRMLSSRSRRTSSHVKARTSTRRPRSRARVPCPRRSCVMRANEPEAELTKLPEKHISSESAKSNADDAMVDDAPVPAGYDDAGRSLRLAKAKRSCDTLKRVRDQPDETDACQCGESLQGAASLMTASMPTGNGLQSG